MFYSSSQAAALFDVKRQTIVNWAKAFEDHLSPTANPTPGTHRQFSEDDMEVLSLIAEMKKANMTFETIRAALDAGQRGDPPPEPGLLLPREISPKIAALMQERDELRQAMEQLKSRYLAELASERALRERAEVQLHDAFQKIDRLNREIGRLEARLDAEE